MNSHDYNNELEEDRKTMELKTMAQIKRDQLLKLYYKAVAVRSSAYTFGNLPEDALYHVEQACEHLHLVISHFDIENGKPNA